MAGYGHVKLSRKFFAEDPLWLEKRVFSKSDAWIDLIQMARYRGERHPSGEKLVRGEVLASIRYLATRWRWTASRTNRFLKWCIKEGRLAEQREAEQGTVYLLTKYDTYQSRNNTDDATSETPSETPDGTAAEQERNSSETNDKAVKHSSIPTTVVGEIAPPTAPAQPEVPAMSYVVRCTVAANRGFQHNILINGRYELAASGQTAPQEWEARGVPVDVAENACYELASDFKPKDGDGYKGFATLAYCTRAVMRAWSDEQAQQATHGDSPTLRLVKTAPAEGTASLDAPYAKHGGTDQRYEELCDNAWRGMDMLNYPDWSIYRPAYKAGYRTSKQRAREAQLRGTLRSAS